MLTPSSHALLVQDVTLGSGAQATGPGQFVTVHYRGWLAGGSEFDSFIDQASKLRYDR